MKPRLVIEGQVEFHNWLIDNIGTTVPGFYRRDYNLVRVPSIGDAGYEPLTDADGDSDGPAQVRPAGTAEVRAVLARNFDVGVEVANKKTGEVTFEPTLPPSGPVGVYLGGIGEPGNALPRLAGVTHTPLLRADGTALTTPGYDHRSKLLYLPPDGFTMAPVPAKPSKTDVAAAFQKIAELVAEFPFVSDSDRVTYIGSLLISPAARILLPPPYPLVCLGAHQQGSGKTLLANLGRILHGGVLRTELINDDQELRKSITSLLMYTTAPIVVWDNVTGILRSGTMAALLTTADWTDRPLGASMSFSGSNDRIWVVSGNNLSLGGDIPRRAIHCRLDPDMPKPWLRTGFTIPDLEDHVTRRRGELIHAVLTLIRAWVVAGRPESGAQTSDSYGRWIRGIGGILEVAGFKGTFADPGIADEEAPAYSDDDDHSVFLHAILDVYGQEKFTVNDLARRLKALEVDRKTAGSLYRLPSAGVTDEDRDLLDAVPPELTEKLDRAGFSKSLGRWLTNRIGRWVDDVVIREARPDRAVDGPSRAYRIQVRL